MRNTHKSDSKSSLRSVKKAVVAALSVVILTFGTTSCNHTGSGHGITSSNYLFTIDEEGFPVSEAKIIFSTYECMNEKVYAEILGKDFWNEKISEEDTFSDYIKEKCVLPELICVKALTLMAAETNITIPDDSEEFIVAAANQYFHNLSSAEVAALGIDWDVAYQTFKDYYLAHLTMEYYSSSVSHEISDEEARIMTYKQIFVKDAKNAEAAYKALTEEKRDFHSVLTEFDETQDDSDKVLSTSKEECSKEFAEVAFGLKAGQFSSIIKLDSGYMIVYCISPIDPDLTQKNKEKIINQKIYDAWYDDYESYMASHNLTINEEEFQAIEYKYDPEVTNDSFFRIYDNYLGQLYTD